VNALVRPVRVQLSRRKKWKMPPNTISVARPHRRQAMTKTKRKAAGKGMLGPLVGRAVFLCLREVLRDKFLGAQMDGGTENLVERGYWQRWCWVAGVNPRNPSKTNAEREGRATRG